MKRKPLKVAVMQRATSHVGAVELKEEEVWKFRALRAALKRLRSVASQRGSGKLETTFRLFEEAPGASSRPLSLTAAKAHTQSAPEDY